ncbi:MAG: citrate/2-methylcitrate synthase, partial [bacterium]
MTNGKDTLTIRDNRTGSEYEVDILEGDVIRAMDLRAIRVNDDDFGMMTYDPGFSNTASTRSTITYIDGSKGILEYRGYPIEQLAERSTFLEVAYLVLHGELPQASELDQFTYDIKSHTNVHENIRQVMHGFRYDAHAMSMLISSVAALGTFYPEAGQVSDPELRRLQIQRLVAKMPTLAAFAYRHHQGMPASYPNDKLSYTSN